MTQRFSSAERIGMIIGSTRPTRICPDIACWVHRELDDRGRLDYVLIDLAEVGLPMLDEPLRAALHAYEHEHTKAWSRRIVRCSGFVLVFPQYNWGYPGVLKNALDYLYEEWRDKPVTTVTYGTRGGARAAEQMHQVLQGLHMRPLPTRVEIAITGEQVDAAWQLKDVEATMRPYRDQLTRVDIELAEALRDARDKTGIVSATTT